MLRFDVAGKLGETASRGLRSGSGPTVKQGKEEFHACQSFNPGLLPTHHHVLEMMTFRLLPSGPSKNLATPSKDEAAFAVGRS